MSLGIVEALRRYALEPSARERVADLASRLMFADPSHDGRSAVAEAVEKITAPCAGCGMLWLADDTRVTDCELCGDPVCPSCIRWTHDDPDVSVAMCPACDAGARDEGPDFERWLEVVEQKRADARRQAEYETEVIIGNRPM